VIVSPAWEKLLSNRSRLIPGVISG
jgi:hypothetical protein